MADGRPVRSRRGGEGRREGEREERYAEAEARFYAAQDASDSSAYAAVLDACGAPTPIGSDTELWPRSDAPSVTTRLSLVRSAASNALGELRLDEALEAGFPTSTLDCAPLSSAIAHFEDALRSWPGNAPALFSLGQIQRDRGLTAEALELFGRMAHLATSDPVGADDEYAAWRAAWVFIPRRAAVAAGLITAALILSQRGEHEAAAPLLRRFGYRLQLSPHVWAAAASPPPSAERATPRGPAIAAAGTVRMFADAVPDDLARCLQAAFAPTAAYWRETGYHTASSEKRYHTFFCDLSPNGASRAEGPSNAVEALIHRLFPLLSRADVTCAEWWVHTRLVGRHPGHQLHYDLEEGLLESTGRVLHPIVSSVVYLSGDAAAGPTIVLDEALGCFSEDGRAAAQHGGGGGAREQPAGRHVCDEPAARCWLAHPLPRAFLTFPGHLLHGVLPVDAPPRGAERARAQPSEPDTGVGAPGTHRPLSGAADDHRLTLLIAWYGEDARAGPAKHTRGPGNERVGRGRRGVPGLGPQSAMPRLSRSTTWPRDLEYGERAASAGNSAPSAAGGAPAARVPTQVPVVEVPHAWESVPPSPAPACGPQGMPEQEPGGAAEPPLEVPRHLEQHFFLRTHADVRERLWREHGLDGEWTKAGKGRKQARCA